MLVDTNVLIRALQPHHPLCVQASHAIEHFRLRQPVNVVPQNLYELWVVVTRPLGANGLGMTASAAHIEMLKVQSLLRFLPDTPAMYATWEALVTRHQVVGKPAHDARLVAAMKVHGLTDILTFDRSGFARFPGLNVIHPADV